MNDVHPGEERGERSERVAQVDVFAAGVRPQRRELGVGHRAGERERAAGEPHAEHGRRDPARAARR